MMSTRMMSVIHRSSKDKGSYSNKDVIGFTWIRIPFCALKTKDGKMDIQEVVQVEVLSGR